MKRRLSFFLEEEFIKKLIEMRQEFYKDPTTLSDLVMCNTGESGEHQYLSGIWWYPDVVKKL